MPDSMTATTYPTKEQYQRWREEAEERNMSVSEFVQAMTEAGIKKFTVEVTPDESRRELRNQRNDLKRELDRARDRISELEDQLQDQEFQTIKRYLESNPGASFNEILQRVTDSAPRRINTHLHAMEGKDVRVDDGQYYPIDEDDSEGGDE